METSCWVSHPRIEQSRLCHPQSRVCLHLSGAATWPPSWQGYQALIRRPLLQPQTRQRWFKQRGCQMYFMNSWALGWSCDLWSAMRCSAWLLLHIILHYYTSSCIITFIIITHFYNLFDTLLSCIITSAIIRYYYSIIVTYYYLIITSLLPHYYFHYYYIIITSSLH